MFGLFIADIKMESRPTTSLLKPVENVFVYAEDGRVESFNTKEEAFERAKFLSTSRTIVIPGTEKAMKFYMSVWAGKGEDVLMNNAEIVDMYINADTHENLRWDYCDSDVGELEKSLAQSCIDDLEDDELTKALDPEELEDFMREGEVVTGYAMVPGKILKKVSFSLMLRRKEVEYKDMTPEEKEYVIHSRGKRGLTLSSGAIYEVGLLRKYNGNKKLVWLHGTAEHYWRELNHQKYMFLSKYDDLRDSIVLKINKYRISKGWV